MELKFGGKLTKGDLLLVSDSGGLHMGIFAGFGRGTIQYYIPGHIVNRHAMYNNPGEQVKYWKTYIYGSNTRDRAVKITPEQLTSQKDFNDYIEAIEILKQANLIK